MTKKNRALIIAYPKYVFKTARVGISAGVHRVP